MNDHDLGGDHAPDPCGAQRDDPFASQKAAARRPVLDRERDKLDRARQVEVACSGLMLPLAAGCRSNLRRERLEAEPTAVGGEVTAARRMAREDDIGCGHDMLGAVRAPAPGRQAAPRVSVVVERGHRHRLADHDRVGWNGDVVLERLTEGPELLVVAVGVDEDLVDPRSEAG